MTCGSAIYTLLSLLAKSTLTIFHFQAYIYDQWWCLYTTARFQLHITCTSKMQVLLSKPVALYVNHNIKSRYSSVKRKLCGRISCHDWRHWYLFIEQMFKCNNKSENIHLGWYNMAVLYFQGWLSYFASNIWSCYIPYGILPRFSLSCFMFGFCGFILRLLKH